MKAAEGQNLSVQRRRAQEVIRDKVTVGYRGNVLGCYAAPQHRSRVRLAIGCYDFRNGERGTRINRIGGGNAMLNPCRRVIGEGF